MGVIPTRMMPMGVWRKSVPPLPYDAEVEYLESTGTQWIDSGVSQSTPVSVTAEMLYTNTSATKFVLAAHISTRMWVAISGTHAQTGVGSGVQEYSNGVVAPVNEKFTLDARIGYPNAPKTGVKVNGGTWASTTASFTFSYPYTLTIFGRRRSSTIDGLSSFRLYSLTVYQADILVRDYIPVRLGTVGYLYDRVSGTLFGNAGTGNFTIGPDK